MKLSLKGTYMQSRSLSRGIAGCGTNPPPQCDLMSLLKMLF